MKDVKLSTTMSASTWSTRLSQIARMKGKIIICTYSLPNERYIWSMLDKRAEDITLIVNEKFLDKATRLAMKYPDMKVIACRDMHAKMVLVEPETVWLSSGNFGNSHWFEHTIGIHDKQAYQFYKNELSKYLEMEL